MSGLTEARARFEALARQRGWFGGGHAIYGVSHDNPDITAPERCRYAACIEIDASVRAEGEVGVQTIPGGLCACTAFSGTPEQIHAAWLRLYAGWLPDGDWQDDDRPAVEAYGDAIATDATTGTFSCRLCLPVRAL